MVLLLGDYLSIVRIYFCISERWKAVMLYSWSIGRGEDLALFCPILIYRIKLSQDLHAFL